MRKKKRERLLLLGAALLAGVVALLWAHQRLGAARDGYEAARGVYFAAASDARRYVAQTGASGSVLAKPPDRAAVTAQLQQVLQIAGLSADAISRTVPGQNRPVPGTNFRREQYTVGLTQLSVNDVAAFVQAWSHESTVWSIVDIQLRRHREAFEATILLECLYIQEEPGRSTPGGS